jgi:hypothetical protein
MGAGVKERCVSIGLLEPRSFGLIGRGRDVKVREEYGKDCHPLLRVIERRCNVILALGLSWGHL